MHRICRCVFLLKSSLTIEVFVCCFFLLIVFNVEFGNVARLVHGDERWKCVQVKLCSTHIENDISIFTFEPVLFFQVCSILKWYYFFESFEPSEYNKVPRYKSTHKSSHLLVVICVYVCACVKPSMQLLAFYSTLTSIRFLRSVTLKKRNNQTNSQTTFLTHSCEIFLLLPRRT